MRACGFIFERLSGEFSPADERRAMREVAQGALLIFIAFAFEQCSHHCARRAIFSACYIRGDAARRAYTLHFSPADDFGRRVRLVRAAKRVSFS